MEKKILAVTFAAVLAAALRSQSPAFESVSLDLGSTNVETGLAHLNVSDTASATVGGVNCRVNNSGIDYFTFTVDNAFSYQGSRPSVDITVEYFDAGFHGITLEYDSVAAGYFTQPSDMAWRSNSGEWRAITWHVDDAYFGGRTNGADFRLGFAPGSTHINRVYVSSGTRVTTDLGSTNANDGMTCASSGTSAATQGSVDCRTNSNPATDHYFYFQVDNALVVRGSRSTVDVTIEYYDSASSVVVFMDYDSTGGSSRRSSPLVLQGTNAWKIHTWHLNDAYFDDRLSTHDFRIVAPNNISLWINRVAVDTARGVNHLCTNPPIANGLTLLNGGDGTHVSTTQGSLACEQNQTPSTHHYFYFCIDDLFAYEGSRPDVEVTLTYYDTGANPIGLQYDSLSGAYTNAPSCAVTGTSTWKTCTWHLTDARFANRQNGGADLRVAAAVNQTVYIRALSIKPATSRSASCLLGSNPPVSQRLSIANDSGGGAWTHTTHGGLACIVNANPGNDSFMHFLLDDSLAFEGSRRDLYFTIRYYDSWSGSVPFSIGLEYDSLVDGAYRLAPLVAMTQDDEWRTCTWYIKDAWCGNRQNHGGDLRVTIPVGHTLYVERALVYFGTKTVANLGSITSEDGLLVYNGADGNHDSVVMGSLNCRGTTNPSTDHYFYFGVDDAFALDGNRRDVYVTIHYYDNGTGLLWLEYDSVANGAYETTPYITKTGSNTWRAKTWRIEDAWFGNGQNFSADFRVAGTDHVYLDMVYVRDFQPVQRRGVMALNHSMYSGMDLQRLRELLENFPDWSATSEYVGTIQTASEPFLPDSGCVTDAEIATWMTTLQQNGKLFSIGAPVVKPSLDANAAFKRCQRAFDRIVAAGGTLDEVLMDEPLYSSSSMSSAVSETVTWLTKLRQRYPDAKVVSTEPHPTFSVAELTDWIDQLNDACAAASIECIDYFSLDPNWGVTFAPYNFTWADCKSIADACRDRAVPFSLLFFCALNPSTSNDQTWFDDIEMEGLDALTAGITAEQYLVSTWHPAPSKIVTETDTNSFTYTVLYLFSQILN